MYKSQILAALKAKFEGVSDAILDRVATKLAKTVATEEDVATSVEGVTFQNILESYGDSRATEATQSAISNYEKKHGLKDGVKTEEGGAPKKTEPAKDADDMPEWAKQLLENNKKLSEQVASFQTSRIEESRRGKLSEVIKSLPAGMRKAYEHTPVAEMTDEAFNEYLGEVTTEVEGINADLKSKGAVFGRPNAGNSKQSGDLSKEQLDNIQHRDVIDPASNKQPF